MARRSPPPAPSIGRWVRRANEKAPAFRPAPYSLLKETSDLGADVRQDGVDLTTEERDRHDRQDGDQGQDQRVLGQALASLVAGNQAVQVLEHLRHPPN